ncbi:core protein precursor pX [Raptor adenovirus 1]|uniref:Core protein pX n=1 Tax=Raptor adenovirus 1 TaxID=1520002 RepID=B6SBM8_9ADEN|nr:core protein precursor pX [Raptor adenovirus 1]ACH89472.1 core protein precursor pX [Raptor adenovirus 1]
MFENLAPKKGLQGQAKFVRFNHELRGGILPFLVPIISSLITAAPAIAGTIIAAKNASK